MANTSDFFENLSRTFSKTADKVVKKTDEIVKVQKVKNKKSTLQNQADKAYKNIGRMIYEEYLEGRPLPEDIAKVCEKIKKLEKEIDACTSEIADLKGEAVCENCGSPIPEGADFCMKCGTPRPVDADADDVEDADFETVDPDDEDDFDFDDEEEEESEKESDETESADTEAEEDEPAEADSDEEKTEE